MSEDGVTRDDLKLTDNCTPNSADAIRELLVNAEAAGERLIVSCVSISYEVSVLIFIKFHCQAL